MTKPPEEMTRDELIQEVKVYRLEQILLSVFPVFRRFVHGGSFFDIKFIGYTREIYGRP